MSQVKTFRTGDFSRDLILMVKSAGVKPHQIQEVCNNSGSITFSWDAFLASIAGVEYTTPGEIANPLFIRGDGFEFEYSGSSWKFLKAPR